jgi:hypothetical protein
MYDYEILSTDQHEEPELFYCCECGQVLGRSQDGAYFIKALKNQRLFSLPKIQERRLRFYENLAGGNQGNSLHYS